MNPYLSSEKRRQHLMFLFRLIFWGKVVFRGSLVDFWPELVIRILMLSWLIEKRFLHQRFTPKWRNPIIWVHVLMPVRAFGRAEFCQRDLDLVENDLLRRFSSHVVQHFERLEAQNRMHRLIRLQECVLHLVIRLCNLIKILSVKKLQYPINWQYQIQSSHRNQDNRLNLYLMPYQVVEYHFSSWLQHQCKVQ